MDCSLPGFPVLHYLLDLLKLMSIELVKPLNHFILCCSLLLLPSIFPSIRVFSNDLIFLGLTGLISLLSKSQGSSPIPWLKSINSSVLSLLCGPALTSIHGKTKALTLPTFVGKVTSLLFNMLSRFVIDFLPRSKCLLISWQ